MRTLTFEQITDGRFDNPSGLLRLLTKRITLIKEKLNIEGVQVTVGEPYEIKWPARKLTPAHSQFRAKFYITKNTRKLTWNDIYRIVNSVKAVPYKFEK